MKERFLIIIALALGLIGHSFGREIADSGRNVANSVGVYCERAASLVSKLADAQSRKDALAASQAMLKELDDQISVIRNAGYLSRTDKLQRIAALQAERKKLVIEMNKPVKPATEIPALPRQEGSLPFKHTVDGQSFTCFMFDVGNQEGDGWQTANDGRQASLSLDDRPGKFYGLDRDQFAVDPNTMKKLQAERSRGKVFYKWRADTGVVR